MWNINFWLIIKKKNTFGYSLIIHLSECVMFIAICNTCFYTFILVFLIVEYRSYYFDNLFVCGCICCFASCCFSIKFGETLCYCLLFLDKVVIKKNYWLACPCYAKSSFPFMFDLILPMGKSPIGKKKGTWKKQPANLLEPARKFLSSHILCVKECPEGWHKIDIFHIVWYAKKFALLYVAHPCDVNSVKLFCIIVYCFAAPYICFLSFFKMNKCNNVCLRIL